MDQSDSDIRLGVRLGICLLSAVLAHSAPHSTDEVFLGQALNSLVLSLAHLRQGYRGLTPPRQPHNSPPPGIFFKAGEQSGKVPEILRKLVKELDRQLNLQRGLMASLIYPVILLILAPILLPLFLLFSGKVSYYFLVQLVVLGPILLLIGGGIWLYFQGVSQSLLLQKIITMVIKIPFFGSILFRLSAGRALRLFGLLLEAGLDIHKSIDLVANSVSIRTISFRFMQVGCAVHSGQNVADGFAQFKDLPDAMYTRIRTGEQSGTLDRALQEGGEELIESSWTRLKYIVGLMPVFLYVLIGIVVIYYAFSIINNYYSQFDF